MRSNKAAIIIVNWNGVQFLQDCLSSVSRQTYPNFDIYFVDNGSTDESVSYVKDSYPNIRLICLKNNYGFAGGNNRGIEAALMDRDIDYIVLLNNDTVVHPDWLRELIITAERDEKIGAVGSKMIFYHDRERINTMGIVPLKNGNALNYRKHEKQEAHTETEWIFAPCAGAALYSRKALEKTGLFDEDYFCYLEDVDLGHRLNKCGFISYVAPRSIVYHIHSGTSSRNNDFKNFLIMRNSLYNTVKHLHPACTIFHPLLTLYYYYRLRGTAPGRLKHEIKTASTANYLKNLIKAYTVIVRSLPKLLAKRKDMNKLEGRAGLETD